MRTLLAALAFALAIPATATPAAACGGDEDPVDLETVLDMARPVRHTASGQIGGYVERNDAGLLSTFISYPDLDGERSQLYGIFVDLRDDRLSRAFARDWKRWSKKWGFAYVTVTVERVGDTGAWRLVSYQLGARPTG